LEGVFKLSKRRLGASFSAILRFFGLKSVRIPGPKRLACQKKPPQSGVPPALKQTPGGEDKNFLGSLHFFGVLPI
jgi:hypothetical protein